MPKVVARIFGGIGNQLFCYAAARRLALVNNIELVLDHKSGFENDYMFQRHYQLDHFSIPCRKASCAERLEPMPRLRRYLLKLLNSRRPFEMRKYIMQEGLDFDERLLSINPIGTLYLDGYWQSERYFQDINSTIRKDLLIKTPKDKLNHLTANKIRSCQAVAIHIRFFDSPFERKGGNLSESYYSRAIAKMEKMVPDARYFVFSDQPHFALDNVTLPSDRMTIVTHNHGDQNAYADLWLMTQCQYFIIANSTFSWWGAWLSTAQNKIVIAPDPKFMPCDNYWRTVGIIPDNWFLL